MQYIEISFTKGKVAQMKNIKTLDCTLRDGGYCNEWKFGYDNTKNIIRNLVVAGIDIIECGFITNRVEYKRDITKFNTVEQISPLIPTDRDGKIYVAMMNYGEYDPGALPIYDGTSINGIRLAFHKENVNEALEAAKVIKNKGYMVFIQAMVSLNYSDEEFISLIQRCNKLDPVAFYIVDSYGVMKQKDLTRLYYLVEHNLDNNIIIGYHSHNNLQLAYSNAQSLTQIPSNRDIIIDSSIYGMGRGAGNLNTELFLGFLNDYFGKKYNIKPVLNLIDTVIYKFHEENYWGYSLPNYLSAIHNVHPNYAKYFAEKNTLTFDNMDDIFSMMSDDIKNHYDKNVAEELYRRYMSRDEVFDKNRKEFELSIAGKKILIVAPGKSSRTEFGKIQKFIEIMSPVVFSVNYVPDNIKADYYFVSNFRRFRNISTDERQKLIVTSNISVDNIYIEVPYAELTNNVIAVKDNAGLMLINFLMKAGVKKVYIAGMDGYDSDSSKNFADDNMTYVAKKTIFDSMNNGMMQVINRYKSEIDIEFITYSRFT